jgi:hydrogenase nickel incorporation protein HypA/HybF
MHEMAIAQDIMAAVEHAAAGRRVRRIVLEIGALSGVAPDAIASCFEIATTLDHEAPLFGARLDIVLVAGRARCHACGIDAACSDPLGSCACGAAGLEWTAGTKLTVRELEVE